MDPLVGSVEFDHRADYPDGLLLEEFYWEGTS